MHDEQLLLVRELRAVAAAIEAAGLGLQEVLAEAGLDTSPADLPDEQLRPEQFKDMWVAATRVARDITIPLAIGDAVPFGTYEVIDYLGSASETVGRGFEELSRYFALITRTVGWDIDAGGEPIRVGLRRGDIAGEDEHIVTQYTLGVTFGRFRRLCEGELVMTRVELAMPEPPNRARHERYFGCAIRYGADETAVYLPRASWDLKLSGREPGLQRVLARHARQLLESRPDPSDPLLEVRRAIREVLSDGDTAIDAVARRVAMSTRTLQRRLRQGGTTFQALVDEERRSAARAYLADKRLAVSEVAYMLGYSEASAFVRAFKRWTGQTPRDFRSAMASNA